jgi:hypothetical protein
MNSRALDLRQWGNCICYSPKSYLHFSTKSPPALNLALHPSTQSHAIFSSPCTFTSCSFSLSVLAPLLSNPILTTLLTLVTPSPLLPERGQYPSISPASPSSGSFSLLLRRRFGLWILSSSPPEPTSFDRPSKKELLFLCLLLSSCLLS